MRHYDAAAVSFTIDGKAFEAFGFGGRNMLSDYVAIGVTRPAPEQYPPAIRVKVRTSYPGAERTPEFKQMEALASRLELRLHLGPIVGVEVWVENPVAAVVRVRMRVPNREPPHMPVDLSIDSPPFPYSAATPLAFSRIVRETCQYAINHELDEGIFVDGVRVFDPHRTERAFYRDEPFLPMAAGYLPPKNMPQDFESTLDFVRSMSRGVKLPASFAIDEVYRLGLPLNGCTCGLCDRARAEARTAAQARDLEAAIALAAAGVDIKGDGFLRRDHAAGLEYAGTFAAIDPPDTTWIGDALDQVAFHKPY